MITKEDVETLAQLARLELGEKEVVSLQKDISGILEYIGQISAFSSNNKSELAENRNVLRQDTLRSEDDPLFNTREALMKSFPARENDFAVVRKIIQKDE